MRELNQSDFDDAVKSGKVVVDFYADWCGPCKAIKPILEDLAKDRTDVSVFAVDIEQSPILAEKYRITSLPTVLLLNDGQVITTMVGVVSSQNILEQLDAKS